MSQKKIIKIYITNIQLWIVFLIEFYNYLTTLDNALYGQKKRNFCLFKFKMLHFSVNSLNSIIRQGIIIQTLKTADFNSKLFSFLSISIWIHDGVLFKFNVSLTLQNCIWICSFLTFCKSNLFQKLKYNALVLRT